MDRLLDTGTGRGIYAKFQEAGVSYFREVISDDIERASAAYDVLRVVAESANDFSRSCEMGLEIPTENPDLGDFVAEFLKDLFDKRRR